MTVFRRLASILTLALYVAGSPGAVFAADNSAAEFKKLAELDFAGVQKRADAGQENAKLELATRYVAGKDVAKDDRKAIEIITALADRNAQATYLMGSAYANGVGVEKSDAKAVEWFRRSAEKGNVNGQYWLGNMMAIGRAGGPADAKAAKPWFEKAAQQGDPGSQYALALIFGNGLAGDPPSWEKAVPLLKKAAEKRESAAAMVLGMLYTNGTGVKKNPDEAAKWFRHSISIDRNAQSQVNLTRLITDGLVKRLPGDPLLDLSPEALGISADVSAKN